MVDLTLVWNWLKDNFGYAALLGLFIAALLWGYVRQRQLKKESEKRVGLKEMTRLQEHLFDEPLAEYLADETGNNSPSPQQIGHSSLFSVQRRSLSEHKELSQQWIDYLLNERVRTLTFERETHDWYKQTLSEIALKKQQLSSKYGVWINQLRTVNRIIIANKQKKVRA